MKTKYIFNFNQKIKFKTSNLCTENIKGFKSYSEIKRIRTRMKM